MTADWYDLAQRLYAARTRAVVARLAAAPIPRVSNPVAVRARQLRAGVTVTAAAPGRAEATARDGEALSLLHDLGVRVTAGSWRTLVTADAATLPALAALARSADRAGPQADTAAHLAWWADRADFPGSSAVVPLTACCQARWVTGTGPAAENRLGTWLAWLAVPGSGCPAMLALVDRVQAGVPLALLEWIERADADSWAAARRGHDGGRDWRQPDSVGQAATGLRARCDLSDMYAAALLTDPLFRRRAVHTGHVVTGTAASVPGSKNTVTVTCDRADARLRAGDEITGWAGRPAGSPSPADRFGGTITGTGISAGTLTLTITGTRAGSTPAGTRVTICPAAPDPQRQQLGRTRLRSLYGTRTSWLTTGRHPAVSRRDVPLDIVVAAAGAGGDAGG